MPANGRYAIDVIDTWAMTIDRVGVTADSRVRVELPGHPYMAVRLTRLPDDADTGESGEAPSVLT